MTLVKAQDREHRRTPGALDRLARRAVLARLAHFPRGRLWLDEPDGARVEIGSGEPAAALRVHDWRLYRRLALAGANGAGEAYMDGLWESPELVEVVRYFAANIGATNSVQRIPGRLAWPFSALVRLLRRNTLAGARRNIAAHYDLGNDFFRLFLDEKMMYSSAVFPRADAGLEEASAYKLDRICLTLELTPEHHLLEIGTGWGGLAIHAARHYGCRVTTTTLSAEQYRHACREVEREGLGDRVTVLQRDYRELEGRYDSIVSVEMVEAVGAAYLSNYFRTLGRLLEARGRLFIQAITIPHERYHQALRRVDFIKRYIFPGGFLPSLTVLEHHLERDGGLVMQSVEDIGAHYARTLAHWRRRFHEARPRLDELGYDQRFRRMWEYYLCYCEGAFREGAIGTVQLVAKPAVRTS